MTLRIILVGVSLSVGAATAQDDNIFEKIQIQGELSQGFMFSSSNNWLTTDSSNGSFRWDDIELNFTDPVTEHLRVAIQLRSYMLGQIGGQKVSIDYASGDYKFNDRFGIRAGKVKTPFRLFNDIQDVDSLYPWALLPQGIYPADLTSRYLAHIGFVAYGGIPLERGGSISWQGFAGERTQESGEGFILGLQEQGITLGDSSGPTWGGDVRWLTPLPGLLVGASYQRTTVNSPGALTDDTPTPAVFKYATQDYYVDFEKGRLKLDSEWNIEPSYQRIGAPQFSYTPSRIYYFMGSWHLTGKLTVGSYYSFDWGPEGSSRNHQDPSNYSRDTALNTRYDFNRHFYAKLEGHYVSGDADSFYATNNTNGLAKVSRLLMAKVGFSF